MRVRPGRVSAPGMRNATHARPDRVRRRRRRWRVLSGAVLVAAAAGGFEAIPGTPGHAEASLLGDLALSDAGGVVAKATSPLQGHPVQPCARLEAEFSVGNHLLRGGQIGWYASVWPTYQALKAMYVSSLGHRGRSCRSDFVAVDAAVDTQYWDTSYGRSPPAFDQGPHAFHTHSDLPRVDDSLWMGLAAMRGYELTGSRAFLGRAEAVFRLATGEWDPTRGGVYWEYHARGATNFDKAIVSNATAAILGAALFSVTGDHGYLTWSGTIVHWLEANLRDPRTGLYDDHVDDRVAPPRLDTVKLTYNQGVMVGAMAALATVDPAQYRLGDAVDLARRSMAYFSAHHSYGRPGLDSIWATNLLWTAGLDKDTAFTGEARASVELAVKAEPTASNGLLTDAAKTALAALAGLPVGRYPALSVLAVRPRPAGT